MKMKMKGEWLAPIAAVGLGIAYLFGRKESVKVVEPLSKDGKIEKDPLVKEQYARIVIPLDVIRNDEEIDIVGDYIKVVSCTGSGVKTFFKLNHRNSRKIYPNEISDLNGNFNKIYLTNEPQSYKELILYVGFGVRLTDQKANVAVGKGFNEGSVGTTLVRLPDVELEHGCSIVVNDMGANVWIKIEVDGNITGVNQGTIVCVAAGQGIAWLPISNMNQVWLHGSSVACDGELGIVGS